MRVKIYSCIKKANGYGIYYHSNVARYEEYWVNDLQDGLGIEVWADGYKFEGYYKEGKKNGIRTYVSSDGS